MINSHTLPEILRHVEASRGKAAKQAVCDRGYRGKREVNGTSIILPAKALKQIPVIKGTKNASNAEDVQQSNPSSVV